MSTPDDDNSDSGWRIPWLGESLWWRWAALIGVLAAATLLIVVVIWAAHRSGPAPVANEAPIASADNTPPSDTAGIETISCWFSVPAERDAQCGVLKVPEQWGAERSRMLRLRFVVFRGTDSAAIEPLVYLAGGPGEPAAIDEASIARWWDWIARAKWLSKRDLVVFDYRGAGLSEPAMNCPELAETAYRVYGETRGVEQANEVWSAAVAQCRDRLRASGIDLGDYTTEAIVADLHSLLEQLGYQSWDFLAVSYGTRVALSFIDRWPEGTRAVILDSVYPPNSNAYVESGRAAANAFAALFKECDKDRACHAAFPTLAETFDDVLRRAAATPLAVSLGAPENRLLHLDAAKLTDVLLTAFYGWRAIAELPATIAALGAGDTRPLQPLALRMLDTYVSPRVSHGLFFSVECHDEYPFNARDAVERAAIELPLYRDFILSNLPLAVCPSWPVGEVDAPRAPSRPNATPVLMLSGELDGITPRDWATLAARNLPNATRLVFRGVGHGVLEAHDCAGLIAARFLDDPGRPPFDDCLLAMGSPQFRVPPRHR